MDRVAISCVRNESDIIETFVRYHSTLFDKIYIVNHRSLDNTEDILQNLKKEGLPLEIRYNSSLRHCQAEILTSLLKELSDNKWIVPLDADEFISPRELKLDLPEDHTYFMTWKHYFPTDSDPVENNVLKRIKFRSKFVDPHQHKVIVPGKFIRNLDIKLPEGSHEVYLNGEVMPYETIKGLYLAHFPVRSVEQIKRKVFVGWLSQVANFKEIPGKLEDDELPTWFHWKKMYDEFKLDGVVDLMEITKLYLPRYEGLVYEPVEVPDFEIKYKPKTLASLTSLANSAEEMAIGLQEAKEKLWQYQQ